MVLKRDMSSSYLPGVDKYKYIYKPKDGRKYKDSDVIELNYLDDSILNKFVVFNQEELIYYVFESAADYFDKVAAVPSKHMCFHEVIFGKKPQKLKFDIDIEETAAFDIDSVVEVVTDTISETYFAAYQRVAELITMDSTGLKDNGNTKYSYHIIIASACVDNYTEAKAFTRLFFKLLPLKYHRYIDAGVNKQLQNFRLINCHKDGRVMRAENVESMDTVIQYTNNCEHLPKLVEDTPVQNRVIADINTESILTLAAEYTVGHKFKVRKGNILVFARLQPTHCVLCERVHHKDNTLMIGLAPVADNNHNIYLLCRHAERNQRKCIGVCGNGIVQVGDVAMNQQSIMKKKIEEAIETCYMNNYVTLFDSLPKKQKHVYKQPTLLPFEYTDTLCVRAAMKMGKTKTLMDYIDKHYVDGVYQHKIVFISFRQTFSGNIKERFKNFTLYSDVAGALTQKKLIVQVESLHRYKIEVGDEAPDLLILDESESIFEQFGSGLLKQFNASWSVFQWLMQYSKHVVAMDANLSDRTYNIINRIRCTDTSGYKIFYHYNEFENAYQDKYYVTENRTAWMAEIYKSLDDDKKIVIPTSSLSMAKLLHRSISEKYPEKYTGIYNSETSADEKREHFADVHRFWSSYDVIIYTPTVSAGISFEAEHFDMLFAFFTDASCTVETCFQMLGRIRNIKSKKLYICLEAKGNALPTDIENIKKNIYESRENLFKNIGDNLLTFEYGPAGEMIYNETNYFYLWLENTRIRNLSSNNFIQRMIAVLYQAGASIEYMDSEYTLDELIQIEIECKEIRKEINTDNVKAIVDAPDLMPDEVEYIEKKIYNQETLNDQEVVSYSRHKLRKDYQWNDVITAKFVEKYKSRRMRRIYKNLSRLHNTFGTGASEGLHTLINAPDETIAETITASLKHIQNNEKKSYLTALEDGLGTEINNKYVFDSHRIAVGLINIAGWSSMYDTHMIPETILYDNLKLNEKIIYDNLKSKSIEFNIRHISPAKFNAADEKTYVKNMLQFVNRALNIMYGVNISPTHNDKEMYMLKMSNMFSINLDDASLPCILHNNYGYEE